MAASNDDGGGGGDGQVWDGYSDYRTISSRIGRNVFDAIDAFADIHSMHAEGVARIDAERSAIARANILSAAMTLKPELEYQEDSNDDIAAILARWEGGESADRDADVPEGGFIEALNGEVLREDVPDWLYQFVIDIRRAGWELGYLKAGRHEDTGPQQLEPRDVSELLDR